MRKLEKEIWLAADGETWLTSTEDILTETDRARLAGCAPELLAACIKQSELIEGLRNLLTFYRIGKRPTEKALDAVQDPSAVQDLTRAVIAKATGRAKS